MDDERQSSVGFFFFPFSVFILKKKREKKERKRKCHFSCFTFDVIFVKYTQ